MEGEGLLGRGSSEVVSEVQAESMQSDNEVSVPQLAWKVDRARELCD